MGLGGGGGHRRIGGRGLNPRFFSQDKEVDILALLLMEGDAEWSEQRWPGEPRGAGKIPHYLFSFCVFFFPMKVT